MKPIEFRKKYPELIKRVRASIETCVDCNAPDKTNSEVVEMLLDTVLSPTFWGSNCDTDLCAQSLDDYITKIELNIKKGE